jgi:predicted lipoprotein with Yx(FWY)xxD motif
MAGSSAGSSAGGIENGGQGGAAAGGTPDPPDAVCVFHADPIIDPSAGAAGIGGASSEGAAGGGGQAGEALTGAAGSGGAPPVYDITVQKNAFVGNYLADSAGKALYVFSADRAGDCENLPLTTCDIGCRQAWPIFNAGERALVEGLSDEVFGTIELEDGTHQTTYYGWPLYYYRNDVAPGDVRGQGVGRVWHLAEVNLPNIVLLRIGMQRLLGDGAGRTLYVFEDDSIGTTTTSPISACIGACRSDFPPFAVSSLAPVSYLEPRDFSIFVRSDGGTQVAYKGAPLYQARADARSGETNGVAETGWAVAAP